MKTYRRFVYALLFLMSTSVFSLTAQAQGQGIYTFSSALNTDFVLDVRYCTYHEEDSHTLQVFRSLDVNQQKFYLEELPGSSVYRILALHSGEALTAENESEEATDYFMPLSTQEIDRTAEHAVQKNQIWTLQDAGDGYYYIRSRLGKYLTVDSPYPYNGAPVILRSFTGKDTQKWKVDKTWISSKDTADTDLINPYGEDGKYRRLQLTIRIGDPKTVLSAADLLEYTAITEDHQLVTDSEAFTALVQKLADQYDTQGHPRTFRTSYGTEIILYKGDFGWKLNMEKTAQAIAEAVKTNSRATVEPVWSHKGASFEQGNDIGDSYVEVDLTNQKVWLYVDGVQILETDCVTGTYGTDRQTPGGVYSVYYRQSPDVLEGPGYSSWVQYWMAFNGGIGLHDANWRSTFGGDIFRYDGSHGCVNLPTEAAAKIYEVAEIGFPVVCYN